MRRLLLAGALLGALVPAAARAQAPDRAFTTPVAREAQASASLSKTGLQKALAREMAKAPGASGAWVYDSANSEVVYKKRSATNRTPASNMKLLTTATAFGKFGGAGVLETQIWQVGHLDGSTLRGNLFLVGGGDPALASKAFSHNTHGVYTPLTALASRVKAAGIRKVTGKLYADDTIFDRRRGVADSGGRTSPYIGPLSGLDFNSGYSGDGTAHFASDPAKVAGARLVQALHGQGVKIGSTVKLKALPGASPSRSEIGHVSSPSIRRLIRETLVPSNNHWAEMLLKANGAYFRSAGTTASGARVVRSYMSNQFGVRGFKQVDGSGLSRPNKVAPAAFGTMLKGMLKEPDHADFEGALPLAGREGTLRNRMRGSAAAARCRAKTGTLHDVSALSGYCFNGGGRVMVFSILQNGVGNMAAAKGIEDRMAAAIASY
ncbi:MAG: hypothetical protein QOG09_855 [Solirubrobacterales bacterium]|nr:hypothetical protein [Solirubrobacterales bacterium]